MLDTGVRRRDLLPLSRYQIPLIYGETKSPAAEWILRCLGPSMLKAIVLQFYLPGGACPESTNATAVPYVVQIEKIEKAGQLLVVVQGPLERQSSSVPSS